MFYPERMKQVKIIIHDDYVNKLIAELHETGLVEITESSQSQEDEKNRENLEKCRKSIQKTEKILEIFKKVEVLIKEAEDEEKSTIQQTLGMVKEILNPELIEKKQRNKLELEDILKESQEIFSDIEDKVIEANSNLVKINEENALLDQQKEKVGKIKHDIDISYLGESDYLIIKAGTTENLFELEKSVEKHPIKIFSKEIEKNYYSIVIIAHKEQREIIEQISRANIFNELEVLGFSGIPSEIIEEIEEKKKKLEQEKERTIETLMQINGEWKERLLILQEELIIGEERKDIFSNLGKTQRTTTINAFVESSKAEEMEELCNKVSNEHCACIFSDPEGNNAPTVLKNPGWASPFEAILNTYSPPKYNEIECTVLLAPIFVVFFGLMLGDAGYGLIILLFSIFGYRRFCKVSAMIKDAAFIGILLGVSTVIFGMIMGSFFGDLIPRYLYSTTGGEVQPLYDMTVSLPLFGKVGLPYDPIAEPIPMLQLSLIFGMSALVLGLILAGVHNLKYKNYSEFATQQLSWYILLPSGSGLIGHFLLGLWTLGDTIKLIFIIIMGIGLFLLFLAHKALFFFEITGFIGDWLSYVRILALGLATAGIAMTVNIMGEVAIEMSKFLIIGAVLIIIFGHLINLGFQGLGAGVHSLRLQYVEFFGKFYEGGGTLFKPFKSERIYTKLKED